jgi:hypothetical protein
MKTPQSHTIEVVKLRGEFTLIIRNKAGKIVERYSDKNLIVNVAKTSLARLLGGDGLNKNVSKIAFGTSATAPDVADTAITGAVVKAISGGEITFPEYNSVLFSWTLGLSEANGLAIAEFGLLSNDNTLFARKVRSVINKTSDLSFSGTWKIIF